MSGIQGSNFSSRTRKMQVKKAISEVVFSLLAFSHEWKLGAVFRGSYPRYKIFSPVSLNVVH